MYTQDALQPAPDGKDGFFVLLDAAAE